MNINLEDILRKYTQAESKRAMGGLYALSGFDFQIRLYVAKVFESLSNKEKSDPHLEALSDIAEKQQGRLVLTQAKLTLTKATLKSAAEEALVIDRFLALHYPDMRDQVYFQVAAQNIPEPLTWKDLENTNIWAELEPIYIANRLRDSEEITAPEIRALEALIHNRIPNGAALFDFAVNRALERKLSPEEARRVHEDILREYTKQMPSETTKVFSSIDRLPTVKGEFFGRGDELTLLNKAWQDRETRIIQFIAAGGTGKTKLLRHWLDQIKPERLIAWSFYSQGSSEDKQTSATVFFIRLLELLDPSKKLEDFAHQPEKLGEHLANLLYEQQYLLILDGLEPLQHASTGMRGELKDRTLRTLLKTLAIRPHNLCIITTRIKVHELSGHAEPLVISHDLDNLTVDDGVKLLRSLKVTGSDSGLSAAVKEYGCHALALILLGNILRLRYQGDVQQRDKIQELVKPNGNKESQHAFKVMQAYEEWLSGQTELTLLYLLGLFDHPIGQDVLQVLWDAQIPQLTKGIDEDAWLDAIGALREDHHLLSQREDNGTLDCHPLIREYFGKQLQTKYPEAWQQGHENLYEYYKSLQTKDQPDTLPEMQPLFSAVAHGCAAGLHQEVLHKVYRPRIQREPDNYLYKKLGSPSDDLAVIAHFFTTPWHSPVDGLDEEEKASVLGWAGFRLRALGRLGEAENLMEKAVKLFMGNDYLREAAFSIGNLCELQLTLGNMRKACVGGDQGVAYADNTSEPSLRIINRTIHADALHQAGNTYMAFSLFHAAEQIQKEWQPSIPYLYGLQGFRYCDLLLAQGNAAEALKRAYNSLKIVKHCGDLLGIALAQLTLGQAYFQQATYPYRGKSGGKKHFVDTVSFDQDKCTQASKLLNHAVSSLRKAGTQHYLPRGLLTRAALYRKTEKFPAAHDDLQEVYDLATPSGMRLHLTDYHLESARLALAEGLPATARHHFDQAEELITVTGYHRRDGELAELKSSLTSPI